MDSVDDVDLASRKWRAGGGMGNWDSDFTVVGRASASFCVLSFFGSHKVFQKCFLQRWLSCLLVTL